MEQKRLLTAEVKATGGDGLGEFEAVASAPTLDRDGEVIASKAFEPLPARVPVHVDHDMSTEGLVGSGTPFYDESGVLKIKGTFSSSPKAQRVRQDIVEGHLGAMSVAFMAAKRQDVEDVPTITKAELLEVSFVTIPSNREALVLAAKSGARHSASDLEKIQTAYEALAALGAVCKGCAERAAAETDPATPDPEKAAAPQEAAAKSPASVHMALAALALAEAELAG